MSLFQSASTLPFLFPTSVSRQLHLQLCATSQPLQLVLVSQPPLFLPKDAISQLLPTPTFVFRLPPVLLSNASALPPEPIFIFLPLDAFFRLLSVVSPLLPIVSFHLPTVASQVRPICLLRPPIFIFQLLSLQGVASQPQPIFFILPLTPNAVSQLLLPLQQPTFFSLLQLFPVLLQVVTTWLPLQPSSFSHPLNIFSISQFHSLILSVFIFLPHWPFLELQFLLIISIFQPPPSLIFFNFLLPDLK